MSIDPLPPAAEQTVDKFSKIVALFYRDFEEEARRISAETEANKNKSEVTEDVQNTDNEG